jgi:hypothetical protein
VEETMASNASTAKHNARGKEPARRKKRKKRKKHTTDARKGMAHEKSQLSKRGTNPTA